MSGLRRLMALTCAGRGGGGGGGGGFPDLPEILPGPDPDDLMPEGSLWYVVVTMRVYDRRDPSRWWGYWDVTNIGSLSELGTTAPHPFAPLNQWRYSEPPEEAFYSATYCRIEHADPPWTYENCEAWALENLDPDKFTRWAP